MIVRFSIFTFKIIINICLLNQILVKKKEKKSHWNLYENKKIVIQCNFLIITIFSFIFHIINKDYNRIFSSLHVIAHVLMCPYIIEFIIYHSPDLIGSRMAVWNEMMSIKMIIRTYNDDPIVFYIQWNNLIIVQRIDPRTIRIG